MTTRVLREEGLESLIKQVPTDDFDSEKYEELLWECVTTLVGEDSSDSEGSAGLSSQYKRTLYEYLPQFREAFVTHQGDEEYVLRLEEDLIHHNTGYERSAFDEFTRVTVYPYKKGVKSYFPCTECLALKDNILDIPEDERNEEQQAIADNELYGWETSSTAEQKRSGDEGMATMVKCYRLECQHEYKTYADPKVFA